MKTRIIAVRHAQGEGNLHEEFHGQYNSDLTEYGILQAQCTAELLRDVKIDACFASDIQRAYNTTCIIAKYHDGLEVIKDESFREIYAGFWERMKFCDIEKQYPDEHAMWMHDLANCCCPNGESVRELSQRVNSAFQRVVKNNPDKTILIGTHATPLRCMGCIWHNMPLEEISSLKWVPNASVSIVDYDCDTLSFELVEYAYSEHLVKAGLLTSLPRNI